MSTSRFPNNTCPAYSFLRSNLRLSIFLMSLISIATLGVIAVSRQHAKGVSLSQNVASPTQRTETNLAALRYPRFGAVSLALLQGQTPTASPMPGSLTPAQPPDNIPPTATTSAPSPEGQINISFDDVPSRTVITNQYPPAVFSTNAPWWVETQNQQYYGSSVPNYLDRGPYVYPHGYAPLYVDFTSPVNNLRFYVVGADNATTVAQINIFQNHKLTATRNLIGRGDPILPALIDLGAVGFNNVTRIEIVNISDPNGIGFDDFSFTVAASPSPTPTPVPSPTPPSTPHDLIATADEEEIALSWTPSQGATAYAIERAEAPATASGSTTGAAPESFAFSPITSSFTCDGGASPCIFADSDSGNGLNSDTRYFYNVTALNPSGASAGAGASNVPLPKPGCSASPTPAPTHGSIANQYGWTMQYDFTPNDGLVISEIYLNGKRMAKQMSVPYYWITTFTTANSNLVRSRGELTPVASGNSLRSRLVDYKINPPDPDKIVIEADYAIDHIPGTPKACLNITEKYEFYRTGANPHDLEGPCEPSDTVHPCNKFRPMIEYDFHGGQGEFLSSLNTPIRLHFQNTVNTGNTVALTQDFDAFKDAASHPTEPFRQTFNPLLQSWWSPIIVPRSPAHLDKNANTVDNFHQTNLKTLVDLPGLTTVWVPFPLPPHPEPVVQQAGCPECVHLHWRWGTFLGAGPNFRSGKPLVPPDSDQTVDIQVVPFKNVFENFHPFDYYQLFNPNDRLRNPQKGSREPYDVVFWYSPTGFAAKDTFFWHTAWFTPTRVDLPTTVAVSRPSSDGDTTSSASDGPFSVSFGSVYETGDTTFAPYDLGTMPALPPGYAALNNAAYLVDTTESVSGPDVVNFSAASVTDQNDFGNLRIFYAEPDPFDPEKPIWVDATILAPDAPAPDSSSKTLSARTDLLGVYVIGKLVQSIPPSSDVANLRVSCTDSADPVTAGNDLTYTVTVTNDGPQGATEVALKNPLSPDVNLISATPSQGTCKELAGVVYCSLNTLAAGASTTVTLLVRPTEGTGSFPAEGKMIANTATVAAKETDTDADNDSVTEATRVMPSSNKPPVVTITSPVAGNMFVGRVDMTINAVATDSDGTIAKVDFFDNEELIGTATPGAGNNFSITKLSVPFGNHSLLAVATDNGGRQNVSNTVDVIVNGMATVNVISPAAGTFASPGSNITLAATASHPSGLISKVEFFANGVSIGNGVSTSGNQYQVSWNDLRAGNYAIAAIATDNLGITTASAPINITVDIGPTVSITNPINGTVFPSATNFSVFASAQSTLTNIARIDFYANGMFIGSASDVGTTNFGITWRHAVDGVYSVTAVATDNLGVSNTSAPITIGVNTASPSAGEFIWFDDDVPPGATKHADGDIDWYWVDANPAAFSGTKAHQSRNFAQLDLPNTSFHKHSFDGATMTMPVNAGDNLFTYVFLDINNMPREIMLEWKDANGWEHRAYWGANRIDQGVDETNSRRYIGPIPKPGQWVRLEVPANLVGLEGSTLNGMAFTLDAGRATWDLAGKATANATPPPTTAPGDSVWIEDGLPTGAVTATVNDVWNWVGNLSPYGLAHQSFVSANHNTIVYRSHSFTGAQTPMQVNPGDILFQYVWMDPSARPDQIMLQWYDGTAWHRAYWGENFIGHQFGNLGVQGTESQRFMGGLPQAGGWYRLEVPASSVGLEGKSVSGMAFSVYGKEPTIAWDRSGKSSQLTSGTVPLALSATSAVWRTVSNTYGYAFETNDLGPADHAQPKISFYAHPNQAAGTVPFYRFRRPDTNNLEYFYSQSKSYDGHNWTLDVRGDTNSNDQGVAFYVYPDATTPGTVPLYLYHDSHAHYFLTTDQNEATGMTLDGLAAYVQSSSQLVPPPPSFARISGCDLNWRDNSATEDSFTIESLDPNTGLWNPSSTVAANTISSKVSCTSNNYYRVRSFNSFGNSASSNEACRQCLYPDQDPGNSPPSAEVVSPSNGDLVDQNFTIVANAFDLDGAGTIAKVEFFANSNKVGEATSAPYVFAWNNVASGTYSLTVTVTDAGGAATTSIPVSVTVDAAPSVSITSPASGALLNATSVNISATASDSDGTISKVEFFQGTTKLDEVASAPYNLAWSNVPGGNYVFTAVATDNIGRATTSSPVGITVNNPPSVSVTASAPQDIPTAPAVITINASASDSDGSISKVEFYQGTTLLSTVLTSPYSYTWSNVPAGTYSITARATDNLGAVTTSNAFSILVDAKPSVSITIPASGASFIAPALVSIGATASDSDGSISKVEFFQGTTLIGTVTASPYIFNWSYVPAGTYTLSAKATDNLGASTTSSSVTINVTPNSVAIGKIAFASNRDGCAQIYLMNTDGTGQSRLSNDTANDEAPKWSPNNSHIVFQSDRDSQGNPDNPIEGAKDIYVMNWDGSGATRLTTNPYDDSAPVWSPDGTRIAFQSARNGVNYQIYVMNADGSGQVNVSNSTANDTQPAWSPDGTKIAFASDRDQPGFASIYVMNANGSSQQRLTFSGTGFRDEQPAWSPDGLKLAFTSTRDSTVVTWQETDDDGVVLVRTKILTNKEVYVMNADGSAQVRLTNALENDDSPAWSPDGTKIAFRSDRERDCCDPVEQIWIMNADGTNQLDLSNNGFGDYCPIWSR